MSGRLHKFPQLLVGDRRAIDPEFADGDTVRRCFFRIVLVRSHAERAAGNPDHVSGVDARCLGHIARHAKARLGVRPRVLAHAPMLRGATIQSSWTVVQCSPRRQNARGDRGTGRWGDCRLAHHEADISVDVVVLQLLPIKCLCRLDRGPIPAAAAWLPRIYPPQPHGFTHFRKVATASLGRKTDAIDTVPRRRTNDDGSNRT